MKDGTMMMKKLCGSLLVVGALFAGSSVQAAVIMDGEGIGETNKNNGSLSGGVNFTYWDNATNNATGWLKNEGVNTFVYQRPGRIDAYVNAVVYNNTGETVIVGHEYTVSADLGLRENTGFDVYVRATENSDGTGASFDLTQLTYFGTGDASTYDLVNQSATGSAAGAGVAGYYIQVSVESNGTNGATGQSYYFDNIVVTSEIPEPGSLSLMLIGTSVMMLRSRKSA